VSPEAAAAVARAPASGDAVVRALWIAIAAVHLLAVTALFFAFRLDPLPGWAALLLYAPRPLFAAPALITAVAVRGVWRLLPALAVAVVAGPLMGLHVNGPSRAGEIRLVTWNVWWGAGNPDAVRAALREANPDIVLLQAAAHRIDVVLREPPFDKFAYVHVDQYVIASRWPARVTGVAAGDSWRAWARFAVDTPLGTLDLISVHPKSPRALLRGSLRRALRSEGAEMEAVEDQLRDVDDAARHAGALRVLAGDFNMPEHAGAMRFFADAKDAFAEVGNGYGYTFPTVGKLPAWMRIDRVLTAPGLRATRARVIGRRGSDHAAVYVELARSGG
jgi:endonuclease/exonuclease/phosphatase (EEP) superfamily protein YafD